MTNDGSEPRSERARELALAAAAVADAEHGTDIMVLEVGGVTIIADYFVLVSARNHRVARLITEKVEAQVADRFGDKPLRVEGNDDYEWVVLDYGDVMVHIFGVETRAFYEIERLYADVPNVEWTPIDTSSLDPDA